MEAKLWASKSRINTTIMAYDVAYAQSWLGNTLLLKTCYLGESRGWEVEHRSRALLFSNYIFGTPYKCKL